MNSGAIRQFRLRYMSVQSKFTGWTNWQSLAKWGNQKLVQRMYIWLFITPAAAKILVESEEWLKKFSQNNFSVDLELPFSWILFFFASLSFTIGIILFKAFCPSIVRNYNNFGHFETEKLPPIRIWDFPQDLSDSGNKILKQKFNIKDDSEIDVFFKHEKLHLRHNNGDRAESPSDLFYHIFEIATIDFLSVRILVFMFFAFGVSLFGYVVFQNILYVFKSLN